MPITFTCECGETISVPDGMEGRIALCTSCRKTQEIPDKPAEEDEPALLAEVGASSRRTSSCSVVQEDSARMVESLISSPTAADDARRVSCTTA